MIRERLLLNRELASSFAGIALTHITREFPNKLDHIMNDRSEIKSPRELHPVFYGSLDWHSCVHAYWLLATVLRLFPDNDHAAEIRGVFDCQLVPGKVKIEVEYLRQPLRGTFERPYGWAWLLMLGAELKRPARDDRAQYSLALQPLVVEFVERFKKFLTKATYPIRAGTHFNTAFALLLVAEYAESTAEGDLLTLLQMKATDWYAGDVDCQAWEPSGDDFLSSALIEANCMQRLMTPDAFRAWFAKFLPRLEKQDPPTLFTPATVSDRSDGKISHLDGLNLSRSWCWRSLARSFPADSYARQLAMESADVHLTASLAHVAGDYMGEHWLATFALLALLEK